MPSYAEYLKVNELLALQYPLSEGPEHDEMLFIVIHQVYGNPLCREGGSGGV
jgi:tryptophan 2,3-dioxygenase